MHPTRPPLQTPLKSSFKPSFASSSLASSSLAPASLAPASPSFTPSAFATSSLTQASSFAHATAPAQRAFDPSSFDPAASLNRLPALVDVFDRYLRLPNTPRAFALYLAALLLVSAGATLYISLAARILEAQVQIARMEQQLATVEQQNGDLLWQIARETNMQTLFTRISAAGYVPVKEREYVTVPADFAPAAAQPSPAGPDTSAAPALAAPPATQHPPAAWQAFFAQRWHAPLPATLTPRQVSLPAASGANPSADRWRLWWEQTVAHSAEFLQQASGR